MFHSEKMRLVAMGKEPAQLVLKNANIIHVFSEEICQGDIAIQDGIIAGVGEYHGLKEVDLTGKYVSPGFIDSHLHIESTLALPSVLAGEVVAYGTTTLIADPHEVGNVKGVEAISFFLQEADQNPLNIYFMLPSCVPATPDEDNGAQLTADDLLALKDHPHVLGLGEMMDYQGVCSGDSQIYKKLQAFSDRPIDGHAPGLSGKGLETYCLSGIQSDHECTNYQEALQKLRAGMFIHIREGSAARNLKAILKEAVQTQLPLHRFSFCSDDLHISDIRKHGHIDAMIRHAIEIGVKPIHAYQMATCNPANHYHLNQLGAIVAGRQADLVVLDDYKMVTVRDTYVRGVLLSEKNSRPKVKSIQVPYTLKNTIHLSSISKKDLQMKLDQEENSAIEIVPNQILTNKVKMKLPCKDGYFVPNCEVCKIIVAERHKETGKLGVGALIGMPIEGAIASTVAHDSHNLIAVGSNDEDILLAIEELKRVQGGYTLVKNREVLATMPLSVCGIVTDSAADDIVHKMEYLIAYAERMGLPKDFNPFVTLSFLSLTVIPAFRITARGLVDVN